MKMVNVPITIGSSRMTVMGHLSISEECVEDLIKGRFKFSFIYEKHEESNELKEVSIVPNFRED